MRIECLHDPLKRRCNLVFFPIFYYDRLLARQIEQMVFFGWGEFERLR